MRTYHQTFVRSRRVEPKGTKYPSCVEYNPSLCRSLSHLWNCRRYTHHASYISDLGVLDGYGGYGLCAENTTLSASVRKLCPVGARWAKPLHPPWWPNHDLKVWVGPGPSRLFSPLPRWPLKNREHNMYRKISAQRKRHSPPSWCTRNSTRTSSPRWG